MSEVAHFEIRVWALEETSNLGYLKLKTKNLLVVVRKSVQTLAVRCQKVGQKERAKQFKQPDWAMTVRFRYRLSAKHHLLRTMKPGVELSLNSKYLAEEAGGNDGRYIDHEWSLREKGQNTCNP